MIFRGVQEWRSHPCICSRAGLQDHHLVRWPDTIIVKRLFTKNCSNSAPVLQSQKLPKKIQSGHLATCQREASRAPCTDPWSEAYALSAFKKYLLSVLLSSGVCSLFSVNLFKSERSHRGTEILFLESGKPCALFQIIYSCHRWCASVRDDILKLATITKRTISIQ